MDTRRIMRNVMDYFIATWELKLIGLLLIAIGCFVGTIFQDELDNPSGFIAFLGLVLFIVKK